MRKILESCPTCGGEFAVTELTCTVCDTVVRSRYSPCPFCRLAPEDLAFLLVFVRNRGNVKEMERELGVSYWTIRGRLTELITAMGLEPGGEPDDAGQDTKNEIRDTSSAPAVSSQQEREPSASSRRERASSAARQATLDRLRRGEITAEEAAKELRVTSDE